MLLFTFKAEITMQDGFIFIREYKAENNAQAYCSTFNTSFYDEQSNTYYRPNAVIKVKLTQI